MLSINLSEVIWTILGFFTLLLLLKRFLYTPVSRFLDEREARVRSGLEAREQAQAAQRALERELEQDKAQALREEKNLLQQERQRGEQRQAQRLQQDRLREREAQTRARAAAEVWKQREAASLHNREQELAALLAEQLLETGNL